MSLRPYRDINKKKTNEIKNGDIVIARLEDEVTVKFFQRKSPKIVELESANDDFENIVIYGAGVSGLITKKTVQNDTRNNQKVICFIDDVQKSVKKAMVL